MISVNQAKNIILRKTKPLAIERVRFLDSLHRTLAQEIRATNDLPPFNRSTVDGFAVRSVDTKAAQRRGGITLKVIDIVPAGRPSRKTLGKNETIKIMTGGVIPQGADAVLMKEKTRLEGSQLTIYAEAGDGENISLKGEDVKKGQTIISRGAVVTPGIVGLLATLGLRKVKVYRRPKAAILVTGNELCVVDAKLKPGKIRSANEYAVFSQIKEAGAEPFLLGIARDNPAELIQKIERGLKYDVLLISGGVSVGDFDLVPEALRQRGVKIFFRKVSVQPGKPLLFGRRRERYVFGLPGNPVSTMIAVYEFVRPFLWKMSGRKNLAPHLAPAILEEDIRLKAQRTKILRGMAFERNGNIYVKLTSHQGSGNIVSVAKANCIFQIKEGVKKVNKGTKILIQYIA